jgi:putative membrane protein
MASNNQNDWLRIILGFHKGDTFRKLLPLIFIMALYSWLIAFLELDYFHLQDSPYLKNMVMLHNLLGFALSLLLVFRTNTAYDRWWEGRRLWGSLMNNSRNLALKLNSFLPVQDEASRQFFSQQIPRFAFALKQYLQMETVPSEQDEPDSEVPGAGTRKNILIQVTSPLFSQISQLYRLQHITGDQLIVLNGELASLMDIAGACGRIKNTPIPYSYSSYIKRFVFIYVITLPIGYTFNFGYLVIPVAVFIFYVLTSLELIAEEIEDPFGKEANDLPLQNMCETIQKDVSEILKP